MLDRVLDSLSRCLDDASAQRLVEFQMEPAIHERVEVLAQRANAGLLTDDERSEYETIIDLADLITVLKIKARSRLGSDGR